ncbi:unnamed protein product, partial [Discosporangium mesarthrocarpum]
MFDLETGGPRRHSAGVSGPEIAPRVTRRRLPLLLTPQPRDTESPTTPSHRRRFRTGQLRWLGRAPRSRIILRVSLVLLAFAFAVAGIARFSVMTFRWKRTGEDHFLGTNRGGDSIPSVFLVERIVDGGLEMRRRGGSARKGLGGAFLEQEDSLEGGAPDGNEVGPVGAELGNQIQLEVCRNTEQGKDFVTDSQGNVCRRSDLDRSRPGCCPDRVPFPQSSGLPRPPPSPPPQPVPGSATGSTESVAEVPKGHMVQAANLSSVNGGEGDVPEILERYSCWGCAEDSSCCLMYELCVSCCMDPSHKVQRASQLARAQLGHVQAGLGVALGILGGGGASGSSKGTAGGHGEVLGTPKPHPESYRVTWDSGGGRDGRGEG